MKVGGAERVAAFLFNKFVLLGGDITLIVTYSCGGKCHFKLNNGGKIVYLNDLYNKTQFKLLNFILRFFTFRSFLASNQPATCISFMDKVNIVTLLACFGLKTNVIACERTFPPAFPLGIFWETLRKLTYPYASRVVVQTRQSLKWLATVSPNAKGKVVPNPAVYPLPMLKPYLELSNFVRNNQKLLLGVGRLDQFKQFSLLIKAFSLLTKKYPKWILIILGEGPDRMFLKKIIKQKKLNHKVKIPGICGNLGNWYERADLYAMSSRFEGFPNSLIEAMSYGCPSICYDCDTGPRDIIRHEVDGLLVRPVGDVSALAGALDKLMGNEKLRRDMAIRAIAVRKRFSSQRIVGLWKSVVKNNS